MFSSISLIILAKSLVHCSLAWAGASLAICREAVHHINMPIKKRHLKVKYLIMIYR